MNRDINNFVKDAGSIPFTPEFSFRDSGTITLTGMTTSVGTVHIEEYEEPIQIKTIVHKDNIEIWYTQDKVFINSNSIFPNSPVQRLYKIIYSCIDGKWNESSPIFGQIIPPQDIQFIFTEDIKDDINNEGTIKDFKDNNKEIIKP